MHKSSKGLVVVQCKGPKKAMLLRPAVLEISCSWALQACIQGCLEDCVLQGMKPGLSAYILITILSPGSSIFSAFWL